MKAFLNFSILLLTLLSCKSDNQDLGIDELGPIEDAPFSLIPSTASGLNFSNNLSKNSTLNIIDYLYYYNGGGVAVGDINNDGLEDIFLTSNEAADKLFLNLGSLKFKDITKEAGINDTNSWSTGVTMSDINNDGWIDIYVCKVGKYKSLSAHNELYINQGNNTFIEQSAQYNLNFSGFSTQGCFFDYDLDGDLDLYLLNHSVHSSNSYGSSELRKSSDSLAGDVLYEQTEVEGKRVFVNVTEQANIYNSGIGYGLAITASDINNDGWLDLYIGNDFHEIDYLYINNGDKTFTESSAEYFNHTSRFTMGVDVADINNDQQLDIFTVDMLPFQAETLLKSGGEDTDLINEIKRNYGFAQQYARNHLQLNQGTHFSDVGLMTKTFATDWSWAPLIFDYDNDGLNDIYVTNGIYKRPNDLDYINFLKTIDFTKYSKTEVEVIDQKLIEMLPSVELPNILFRNRGNLDFKKTEVESSNRFSFSNGAAFSDLDNDGDLDIIVNNINMEAFVLKNNATNNYLSINLKGENGSINTQGTKVYAYINDDVYYKEQAVVRGFQSSSTSRIYFGLGSNDHVDSLRIVWYDKTQSILKNLRVNQFLEILKDSTHNFYYPISSTDSLREFDYIHKENSYKDYDYEPMIPEKLSMEGPSVVYHDFNGDGFKDLLIGGARNQPAFLYIGKKNNGFHRKEVPIFLKDSVYEDVDAVALDVDNDGDLDLYVASGGGEILLDSDKLEDRIYLNDGNANFSRLEIELPKTNGGAVEVLDYNKDGLIDIFIGSRSVPGQYGVTPESYLIKNFGGGQLGIANAINTGMITDAIYTDLDYDGKEELVLCGDWMPITILSIDQKGNFENVTAKWGLEKSNGMWNCLNIVDINSDGKLDIIAGNSGLNFKWEASLSEPILMYTGDYNKDGLKENLIFYKYFDRYIPFATRDKLVQNFPLLRKKYLKYTDYATVKEIYDFDKNFEADSENTKKIFELRSMIFINDGLSFKGHPLPSKAQASTVEDLIVKNKSIYFVGNHSGFVVDLGESSANSGGVVEYKTDDKLSYRTLNLPKHIIGRRIIEIDENTLLIITNNGKSYLN